MEHDPQFCMLVGFRVYHDLNPDKPCDRFAANATLMGSKESKRTVRLYNRLARALVEFEALWYATWLRGIESAVQGLQAPLLVQHPESGAAAAFGPRLRAFSAREVRALDNVFQYHPKPESQAVKLCTS